MSESISTPFVPQRRPIEVFVVAPPRPRYWLHGLLLALTFLTTLMVGARFQYNFQHNLPLLGLDDGSAFPFPLKWIWHQPSQLLMGIPFAICLMGILLAHEMGHYVYCRRYGVHATLPFFLPAPTLIGTLGAFIRIKSPIRTRKALFDIGISGPIAGFVVALPPLCLGLALSHPGNRDSLSFGFPLIFSLVHPVFGPHVPLDHLQLHPIAIAAWFGMFATSLNLLPGGQLDGGHIVASIWPRAHRWISGVTIAVLLWLAWTTFAGWLIWSIFLVIAFRHPWVSAAPKLNASRLWIAVLGVIMLAVTVAPRPFASRNGCRDELSVRGMIQQFQHGGDTCDER
jgi:Zn-dependent protease